MRKFITISIAFLFLSISGNAQTAREQGSVSIQPMVRLYPNPATSYIQIEWNNQTRPANLQIFNGATGKRMLNVSIGGNESLRINLNDYTRGLYIFQLFQYNGSLIEVGKFQVAK